MGQKNGKATGGFTEERVPGFAGQPVVQGQRDEERRVAARTTVVVQRQVVHAERVFHAHRVHRHVELLAPVQQQFPREIATVPKAGRLSAVQKRVDVAPGHVVHEGRRPCRLSGSRRTSRARRGRLRRRDQISDGTRLRAPENPELRQHIQVGDDEEAELPVRVPQVPVVGAARRERRQRDKPPGEGQREAEERARAPRDSRHRGAVQRDGQRPGVPARVQQPEFVQRVGIRQRRSQDAGPVPPAGGRRGQRVRGHQVTGHRQSERVRGALGAVAA